MYTQEQVVVNFNLAQKRILPARLRNAIASGHLISAHMHKNKIEPSPEGFYSAINTLVENLDWDVKPAKLLAIEANSRPATITSAQESNNNFTAKVRAGEAADAKKEADAEAFKQAESAISAYTPIDKRGRVAFGKQTEQQARLRGYVAQQVARNADAKSILEQVVKEIARLYSVDEKANERV